MLTEMKKNEASVPRFMRGVAKGAIDGSGIEKVARFLLVLGKDEAAAILMHLSDAEAEAVAAEIAKIKNVGSDEARAVLEEFGYRFEKRSVRGGVDIAEQILSKAFGEERGRGFLKKAVPDAIERRFSFLASLETAQLATLFKGESAAVVAVIVAHLDAQLGANILDALAAPIRGEIVRRVATMKRVDSAVVSRIEEALKAKIRTQGRVVSEDVDGKAALASMLRFMDLRHEQDLIEELSAVDPELGQDIRDRMFTVDTLLLIDDGDLQSILRELDEQHIALILKGKEDRIRAKILDNVSTRRRDMIMGEYHALGPRRRSEVDEATGEFISTLRRLERDGKLLVRRSDDEYTS